MPILTIISELQAQIPQLEEAYEIASQSYRASCSEDDPNGCFMLEMEWEMAWSEFEYAKRELAEVIEAVNAL